MTLTFSAVNKRVRGSLPRPDPRTPSAAAPRQGAAGKLFLIALSRGGV
jgi:hypothetical protein